jgi:hypothetical protein
MPIFSHRPNDYVILKKSNSTVVNFVDTEDRNLLVKLNDDEYYMFVSDWEFLMKWLKDFDGGLTNEERTAIGIEYRDLLDHLPDTNFLIRRMGALKNAVDTYRQKADPTDPSKCNGPMDPSECENFHVCNESPECNVNECNVNECNDHAEPINCNVHVEPMCDL